MIDQHRHISVISFESEGIWHSVGAIKLDEMLAVDLALVEHGMNDVETYQQDVWQRQLLLINSISSPVYFLSGIEEVDRQFELRFISLPDQSRITGMSISLLFKMSHVSEKVSRSAVIVQLQEFKETLGSLFPESIWSFVSSETELESILLPFSIHDGIEIGRRVGQIDVSGNINETPNLQNMGFSSVVDSFSVQTNDVGSRKDSVCMVFPYIPVIQGWGLFCRRLLQSDKSIMLRLVVRPSMLDEHEKKSFGRELTWLHSVLNRIDKNAAERNIFRPQLEMLIDNYTHRLFAFQDRGLEVYSEIYSNVPLATGIADYFGATVTRQPSSGNYNCGGFEWNYIRKDGVLSDLVRSMQTQRSLASNVLMQYPRWRYLMEAQEALAIFHLPFISKESFPGVKTRLLRNVPSPMSSLSKGSTIGESKDMGGRRCMVVLGREDRRRHLYITGQTGSGKSTLIEKMVLDDILDGEGVCLIDPHGDLAENVLGKVPEERMEDVVYLNPAMDQYPLGINMLEFSDEREKLFVVQEIISMIERLFDDKYTGSAAVTGPMFYHNLRMGLLYVMSDDNPVTLLDLYRFFTVPDYYRAFDVTRQMHDPLLQAFHKSDTFNYFRKGTEAPFAWYIVSKFDNFLGDPVIRNIICQPSTTVDFESIMNNGKILIVNLAKGLLGEVNSRFLGMLVVGKLQLAAMRRVNIPEQQRKDFYLYVDEFQNLATKNFSTLLSESRKFRLNLVLANQFVNQLAPDIVDALMGNVGSTIIFRTGVEDAAMFERVTEPVFSKNDLLKIPNWHAVALLQQQGQVVPPFTLRTVLHSQKPNKRMIKYIEDRTIAKYGQERKKVEMGIRFQEELRMELVERKLKEISEGKRIYRKEAVG